MMDTNQTKRSANVLHLVQPTQKIDSASKEKMYGCATALAEAVQSGEMIGLMVLCQRSNGEVSVLRTGSAVSSPAEYQMQIGRLNIENVYYPNRPYIYKGEP